MKVKKQNEVENSDNLLLFSNECGLIWMEVCLQTDPRLIGEQNEDNLIVFYVYVSR